MLRMSALDMYRDDYIYEKVVKTRFLDANRRPLLAHEYVLIFGKKLPRYYPQKGRAQETRYRRRQHGVPHYIRDKMLERVDTFNNGESYPSTLLPKFYDRERHDSVSNKSTPLHPTQKPVALFEYLIKTYTLENEIILDMTCGSGTTAIAARKTGRRFICGDNSPEYVALAQQRLQTTDPYQDSVLPDGTKQLSLFAS
jgi:site-specific DNA-methyltransferase (adenine-specific)